ncbi:MAG: DUF1343 domain-containing protein, partial [Longimicrobiales bacterium]|nr:DUF1343 domain-containing protein [Longimicrobiales bacterium]
MASTKPPQWSAAAGWGLVLTLILATACGNADPPPSGESTGDSGVQATAAIGGDGSGSADEVPGSGRTGSVRPGIDVLLSDSLHLVRGRRVGLITNQTGVGRDGTPSIDLLWEHPEVELVALFSPEHGIRGDAPEGETIEEDVDSGTGLVVHSLYGDTRSPTPEMLEGIDVLLFDMQDVGARYYTYVSTMTLAMEAAAREGVRFLVLDRPNP